MDPGKLPQDDVKTHSYHHNRNLILKALNNNEENMKNEKIMW